jgi:hypothetical protein
VARRLPSRSATYKQGRTVQRVHVVTTQSLVDEPASTAALSMETESGSACEDRGSDDLGRPLITGCRSALGTGAARQEQEPSRSVEEPALTLET